MQKKNLTLFLKNSQTVFQQASNIEDHEVSVECGEGDERGVTGRPNQDSSIL